jgi:hypothetical protein
MKPLLLLALSLIPLHALAFDPNCDPNLQDRIDQATQPLRDAMNNPNPVSSPAPTGPAYVCIARDAKGRSFRGSFASQDVSRAKAYAVRACSAWFNKGCRVVSCAKR